MACLFEVYMEFCVEWTNILTKKECGHPFTSFTSWHAEKKINK